MFTDVKLDGELNEAINKTAAKDVTLPRFSYNNYIAKAILYSSKIICKNHSISYDDVAKKIKDDPVIKTEFKKLVSDFMMLGGVELSTMKRTVVKK